MFQVNEGDVFAQYPGHHGPLGPPLQQGTPNYGREHGPSAPPLVCPPLKSEFVALKN